MERPFNFRAEFKHHLTKKHQIFLKQSVMDIYRYENLYPYDLLALAKNQITESGTAKAEKAERQTSAGSSKPGTEFWT